MSKLENQYNKLKTENKDTLYLLRSGIFYVMLNEDAILANEKLGLKITDLSPNIIKCGFPIKQIEKYKNLLEQKQIRFEIVDNLPNSTVKDYLNAVEIKQILNKIAGLDMNEISYKQAYDILADINLKLKNKPTS